MEKMFYIFNNQTNKVVRKDFFAKEGAEDYIQDVLLNKVDDTSVLEIKEYTPIYLDDYSDDALYAFFNKLNVAQIEETLNKKLGLNLNYLFSLQRDRYGQLTIVGLKTYKNLVNESLILKAAFKDFYLDTSNSSMYCDSLTGELNLSFKMVFRYECIDFGNNAVNICRITMNENEGTKIRFEGEN